MKLAGFTWFYIGLAVAFCFGVTEPGLMAGLFWLSIGIFNEFVDRLDRKGSDD